MTVSSATGFPPQEKQKPHNAEADFLLRVFTRERRNAELSYLLPIYFRPTVKNPVCRPFLLARQLLITYRVAGCCTKCRNDHAPNRLA